MVEREREKKKTQAKWKQVDKKTIYNNFVVDFSLSVSTAASPTGQQKQRSRFLSW
jgi:hypothetical protein